jgi:hypothetical protein
MAGRTVDQSLHALDIGLPRTIGTPMGVGNLDTEGHTLVAELAFCHPLHLLAVTKYSLAFASRKYINRWREKMQVLFTKKTKKTEGRGNYCESAWHTV